MFLNWRDAASPEAGGAETFTEEIAKRLVKNGHEVTIFASRFPGSEGESNRFGMRIVRQGGKYTVFRMGRSYVRNHLADFDVFIDEIKILPFRIKRMAKGKRVFAVIHQMGREVWYYETPFPLSLLGYYVLEPWLLKSYRKVPTIAVSASTKKDLVGLGFENVKIVHNGIGVTPLETVPNKENHPVMIYVGRLVKYKLPEHAIRAFRHVRNTLGDAELWVVGDGYQRTELARSSGDGVTFFGRVSEEKKLDLLKRAHVLLVPSVREGWGISVIEANAMGTPAVGYNIPGLRDSIVDGKTGFLAEPLNPAALAEQALKLLRDKRLAESMSLNALKWSTGFTWDRAAREFGEVIQGGNS